MTMRSLFKVTERYVVNNSPTLISALAVTGAIGAVYLTGKATFRAAELIAERESEVLYFEPNVRPKFETKEKVKLVWKEYIPPALVLAGTIGCIMTANSISATRMAGLAAAYKVSEKQFDQYRDKARELFGEKKAEEITDAVHADTIARHPVPEDDFGYAMPGIQQWCFDLHTGRYFKSDMQTIRAIGNDINRQLIDDTYVRLSEFYDRLGLPETKMSGEIGWTLEHPLDLKFSTQLADGNGGVPVLVVDFRSAPISLREYRFFPGCENEFGIK